MSMLRVLKLSLLRQMLGAMMLLGLASGQANAVTLTTGDVLRIDFDVISFYNSTFGYESGFSGINTSAILDASLYTNGNLKGTFFGGIGGASIGTLSGGDLPPFYWLISVSAGQFDLVSSYFLQGEHSVSGTYTLNDVPLSPVPIPAALPFFAAGLSAMGFMGWRKRRRAA